MFNDDISAYAPSWLFPNQIRYLKLCIFSYLYIPIVHNVHNLVNSQTSLTVLIFHILTHTSHKLYHTLNSLKHTHAHIYIHLAMLC
jgi:hypothetical protein